MNQAQFAFFSPVEVSMPGRLRFQMVQEITPAAFGRSMNAKMAELFENDCEVERITFRTWQSDEDTCGYEAFVLYREKDAG